MQTPTLTGPLAAEALAAVESRLDSLDRVGLDAAGAARRLLYIAEALTQGRPEKEMFELAMTIAAWGRFRCLLRDQPRSPALSTQGVEST